MKTSRHLRDCHAIRFIDCDGRFTAGSALQKKQFNDDRVAIAVALMMRCDSKMKLYGSLCHSKHKVF